MTRKELRKIIEDTFNYITTEGNSSRYAINGGYLQGGINTTYSTELSEVATSKVPGNNGEGTATRGYLQVAKKALRGKGFKIKDDALVFPEGGSLLQVGDYIENVTISVYMDDGVPAVVIRVHNPVKNFAGDYGDAPSGYVNSICRKGNAYYTGESIPLRGDNYSVDEFIEKFAS